MERFIFCVLVGFGVLIGCGAPSFEPSTDADAYCGTEHKATTCAAGEVLFECYRGAVPITDGTCRHILTSDFPATAGSGAYTEADYCCSDESGDAGTD